MALDLWNHLPSKGRRLLSIGVLFILCIFVTIAGVSTPLSQEEINQINDQINQTQKVIENAQGLSSVSIIFGNNFMLCLMMFIPFFGPFFSFLVLYNTGNVIAAQSSLIGASPLAAFLSLFIFPFTWLEFLAYATASTQSFWLLWRIIKHRTKRELVNTCILISICALMLLAAAIIEVAIIALLTSASV